MLIVIVGCFVSVTGWGSTWIDLRGIALETAFGTFYLLLGIWLALGRSPLWSRFAACLLLQSLFVIVAITGHPEAIAVVLMPLAIACRGRCFA